MSVTLGLGDLANQIRVITTKAASDIPISYVVVLTQDLAAATEMVERRAPLAPDNSHNKAVVQIVGYWFESPQSAPQRYGYNAWLHSGAAQVLAPWVERRAQPV